jgi:glycosyltransferase involved in cell wall biosynthesis
MAGIDKMKILVICQYYFPEPFRHPDICEELVKCGHDVTVVTGLPNYPMGEIYEGYRNGERRDEVRNGVKIHRCFTVGRKHGTIHRFLNYYSYAFSSEVYVKKMKEKYDVVFVNQLSPVMMANAAIAYKKKHKTPVVLYCLDLWPESLVAGGIDRNHVIYKFFHKISARIYKRTDKILITSRSFADYFEQEFDITDTKYLPQYAETIFTPKECKKEKDTYIDLMFAGNIGAAQSVDTIIKAAQMTKDIPNLRWHIVGDGSELENLQSMAQGMKQVIFHGRKPLEEMPKYYAMADAMLVTMQKDQILSLTLPGKVQTYMAAGKPIIGAIDGETAQVITDAQCGLCGSAEDANALVENVRKFVKMNREQLGKNARVYYEGHFEKQLFMDFLEKNLEIQKESNA